MKSSRSERTKRPLELATHLESPGFVLGDVTRLMRRGFDRKVRDLGLTRPQWRVLVYVLDNEGLSQSELARRLELERAPLGQLVRALENLRLVSRRRSTEDAREWMRIPVIVGAHSTRWRAPIPRDRGRRSRPMWAWSQALV